MTRSSSRRVRFAAEVHRGFARGVNQLTGAIRPTIGPTPRLTGIERPSRSLAPELLDDGATIARRMLQLPDPVADPGAMYLRGMLWRLQEDVGDGSATAALLFRAVLADGRRVIAAGTPAQPLRSALERIAGQVAATLDQQAVSERSERLLTGIARSASHDPRLAPLLGEIFDIIGPYGQLDLRESHRPESWAEYVEGSWWETGALTTALFTDEVAQRTDMQDAVVLISDFEIDDPAELIPLLELTMRVGATGLLILAKSLSSRATGLLTANLQTIGFPVMVVKAPGFSQIDQIDALDDLSFLLGGRALRTAAGDHLRDVTAADLGGARRAWATRTRFGIISGMGDPRPRRMQIRRLEAALAHADKDADRQRFLGRLGKFQGGSATLWIGGTSESEAKQRSATATRTARVLRGAAKTGVVPGGGAALIACRPVLQRALASATSETERTALRIVHDALAIPAQAIFENAGLEANPITSAIEQTGGRSGYDVLNHRLTDLVEAGVVDSLAVLRSVVQTAISSAALALTIDVIVHTKKTDITVNPEG